MSKFICSHLFLIRVSSFSTYFLSMMCMDRLRLPQGNKQISLTLVLLELRGVVLRQTIAKSIRLFTYENWHLFNLHSLYLEV